MTVTDATDEIIEQHPPGALKPWRGNARTHSKKQLRRIADSIATFGFTNPVLIDEAGSILAGHGRVEAAKLLGLATVPCRRLSTMTPAQKRAYVIADNQLALTAGWDEDLIAGELGALAGLDLDFDLTVTGFEIPEIDRLIDEKAPEDPCDPRDDALPDVEAGPTRCRPGDLWQLGPHRLACGSALDAATVALLMDGAQARLAFASWVTMAPMLCRIPTTSSSTRGQAKFSSLGPCRQRRRRAGMSSARPQRG